MTTVTKKIEDGVKALVKDGATVKKIKGYLAFEEVSAADSKALLEKLGVSGKKAGFADNYYAWLSAEARTLEEAESYVMDESNSDNVRKHKSHYLNIARLALSIWESK